MTQHQTSRTLVKSAPELWAECSDAASLARHLGAFGEIRITKLEPETAVAWEGTAARGTVKLEPSGWGTRVTLTLAEEETTPHPGGAGAATEAPAVEEPVAAAEPVPMDEPVIEEPVIEEPAVMVDAPGAELVPVRSGLFARLMMRFRGGRPELPEEPEAVEPAPEAVEPEPAAAEAREPGADGPGQREAALAAALDSLGRAHHRPYSRA
jgi:hypothetical protein